MYAAILALMLQAGGDNGYSVRFDGEVNPKNRALELVDADGRVKDIARGTPAEAPKLLAPRDFRVSLFGGGGESYGKAAHALLTGRARTYWSLDAVYQPGAFGLDLSYDERSYRGKAGGIDVTYEAKGVRAGAVYTVVPAKGSGWFVRRLHLDLLGGLVRAQHKLELKDGYSQPRFGAVSYGGFAGTDLRLLIPGNVWFSLRYQVSVEPLHFETLGVSAVDQQQTCALGVGYAF